METKPTFESLKDDLRVAYILKRRRKQPGYRGGDDLEKALDGAAQNCIAARMTAEDYITALYYAYAVKFDKFFPNQLQGAKALAVATTYAANFEKVSFENLWNTQWVSLKQAIDNTNRKVEDILFDHAMAFTPWFRIIATVRPDTRIVAAYGRQAKEDMTKPLKAFLESKVPAHLDRVLNYERYLSPA